MIAKDFSQGAVTHDPAEGIAARRSRPKPPFSAGSPCSATQVVLLDDLILEFGVPTSSRP